MISRPRKNFYKKYFLKKFIILIHLLSYIHLHTAIVFCINMWITFYFLFSKNIFYKKILKIKINFNFTKKVFFQKICESRTRMQKKFE